MSAKGSKSKKSSKAARFDRKVRRIVRDEMAQTGIHAAVTAVCDSMGIDPEQPMTAEQHAEFAPRLDAALDDAELGGVRV